MHVKHKRFAVLFFLPSCCISSILFEAIDLFSFYVLFSQFRPYDVSRECAFCLVISTCIVYRMTFERNSFLWYHHVVWKWVNKTYKPKKAFFPIFLPWKCSLLGVICFLTSITLFLMQQIDQTNRFWVWITRYSCRLRLRFSPRSIFAMKKSSIVFVPHHSSCFMSDEIFLTYVPEVGGTSPTYLISPLKPSHSILFPTISSAILFSTSKCWDSGGISFGKCTPDSDWSMKR